MNKTVREYIAMVGILVAVCGTARAEAQGPTDPKVEYYLAKKDWDSLVRIGQRAIPSLVVALSDNDESVRAGAIDALGRIGGHRGIEPMVVAMKNEKVRRIRQKAAKTLVKLGYAPENTADQVALHVAIGDKSVEELVKIGPKAVIPLCELLYKLKADKSYDDAVLVVNALVKIRNADRAKTEVNGTRGGESPTSQNSVPRVLRYSPDIASKVVATLIAVADGKDSVGSGYVNVAPSHPLTCAAVSALGKIRDPNAVDPLVKLLTPGQNNDVVNACAIALGEMGDPRAAGPLGARLLKYRRSQYDTDYRPALCDALVRFGAVSVEPLIKALSDRSNGGYQSLTLTCTLAAKALGELRDKRAVEPLCSLLNDKEQQVRRQVVVALGKLNDQRAIDPLIGALKDSDSQVRAGAAEALDTLGWKP